MKSAAAVRRMSARGEPSFLLSFVLTMVEVEEDELLVEVRVEDEVPVDEDRVDEDWVDVELAEPVTVEELAELVVEEESVPEDEDDVPVAVPVVLLAVEEVELPVVVAVAAALPAYEN